MRYAVGRKIGETGGNSDGWLSVMRWEHHLRRAADFVEDGDLLRVPIGLEDEVFFLQSAQRLAAVVHDLYRNQHEFAVAGERSIWRRTLRRSNERQCQHQPANDETCNDRPRSHGSPSSGAC